VARVGNASVVRLEGGPGRRVGADTSRQPDPPRRACGRRVAVPPHAAPRGIDPRRGDAERLAVRRDRPAAGGGSVAPPGAAASPSRSCNDCSRVVLRAIAPWMLASCALLQRKRAGSWGGGQTKTRAAV
jgi:hypothetical protein